MPHQDLPQRLVLIRQCERFAELPGRGSERHGVYKVQNVVCVPISPEAGAVANLGLKPCPKHHPTTNLTGRNLGRLLWRTKPPIDLDLG